MNETIRYLCFSLGHEEFAIPLLKVKEVIGLPETTPIPQAQPHFVGIMNLRGSVISVLDMRTKLSIKPGSHDETTVIILDLGETNLGVVVDCVNSVIAIPHDQIAPKPLIESSKASDYITGVYRKDEHLVLMLDIGKTLSVDDRATLSKATAPKAA